VLGQSYYKVMDDKYGQEMKLCSPTEENSRENK
jgi:hypothetical protein